MIVAQYEMQFTKLSKYAPEMVNTEAKRNRRFQQGLNVEIQDALVTARVDTYAEVVEMTQRIEDSKARVREFHNAKRAGPKTWDNRKGSTSQGQSRPQQRGPGSVPQSG